MDILVADDDRIGRFLLNSALCELGHSVTEATMDVMPGKLGNASATS
jgi:CheY-like chemotaxis protein